MGALGCPAAAAAARAGVRRFTFVDPDRVEASNLQRQTLFGQADIGGLKVEAAAARIDDIVPGCEVSPLVSRLQDLDPESLFASHGFVIDATDDPATKLLINRTAVATHTAYSYGGVMRLKGQTMTIVPGVSACLTCAFPALECDPGSGSCADMGILAPVAGVIGSLQGRAAGCALVCASAAEQGGRMIVYQVTPQRWTRINFEQRPDCPTCAPAAGLQEYGRRLQPCLS